jgi:hypothetical protein
MFKYEWDGRDSDSFDRAVEILRQVTVDDGIGCACSDPEHGPSPLSVFILCFMHKKEWEEFVELLGAHIHGDETVAAMFAKPIIRLLAHEALEIRHTCCVGVDGGWMALDQWCDPKGCEVCDRYADLEEIRDEDAAAHEMLELLVAELYACFESNDLPVFDFIDQVGWDLIQDAVDALHGAELTEAQREGWMRLVSVSHQVLFLERGWMKRTMRVMRVTTLRDTWNTGPRSLIKSRMRVFPLNQTRLVLSNSI